MEIAAATIAFAQGISMVTTGIRTLHSIRQAPIEFMDLLNQLSTLNGRAELLRRSLDSLAGTHSSVLAADIDTIRNLQSQFEDISTQLNDTATKFIAKSQGLDAQGRHRIPRIQWQREQSNLMRLRDQVRQLSSDMTDCLAAINTSQGIRQTGLLLDVRAVMEQSFMDAASQIERGNTLTEQSHESNGHILHHSETQTALLRSNLASHQEASAVIGRRLDVFETRVETQLSQVMARLSTDQDSHSSRTTQGSQNKRQSDLTVVSISTTLRPTCPPGCRCQCHRTSYARTPGWLSSVMGSLFVQYKSLPILGIKKCDTPLCQSASQSSLHLQWCFPRWLVARALVASLSWSSISDDGAVLFFRIPRSINGFQWLIHTGQATSGFIEHFKNGTVRPTDIFAESGQTFLTRCLTAGNWRLLPILLDAGFDPKIKDLTGRSAIAWARQWEVDGVEHLAEETQVTLREISAMELEDAAPLTMMHQAIHDKSAHSLDECIQMEPHHINTPDDVGFAPLHWAVRKEDMAALQTLIKASANVNQQTSHGRETSLDFACLLGNAGMVRTLLEAGASPSSLSSEEWAPLHYALGNILGQQNMEIVQMLLDAHADPSCMNRDRRTPLHLLFYKHANASHLTAIARALINAGADLEAKDIEGRTPLLLACQFACRNVPLLIDLGANTTEVDDDGDNLLLTLITNKIDLDPSLLRPETLLGIDPDARDEDKHTSLDFLALRMSDPIYLKPLQTRVVVNMVNLILKTREGNWDAGLFLDKKQELEADGSHAQMRNWVMRQRQLMQRDASRGDSDFEEDDLSGWYRDEFNFSTASDHEQHLSDGGSSGSWETVSDDDEQDSSGSEDSVTFHDAHENLA